MELLVIDTKLGAQVVNALCNTLVYSLWQGLLLAAVAGLIVICTRKLSAALRYNLLVSALLLFIAGIIITFIAQLKGGQHVVEAGLFTSSTGQIAVTVHTYQPVAGVPAGFLNFITGYLNSHDNTIVLIWFLMICARSIQFGVGLHGTYRLKKVNVFKVTADWQARTQQLALMLGITQCIMLLESGLAKVPLVIGHLKPVILIPAGLLTSLTTEEIEAVLVHELAHIRRRDYLVNLLQNLMEIIFFFNPAVLWVSQLIKTERENCCDDLALGQNNNKASYIRALLSCEEYRSDVPAHAMAFPGGKHNLLNRVKRMAVNRNHSLNVFEKTVLAVCLVISGLCISAFEQKQDIKRPEHKPTVAAAVTQQGTPQSTKKQEAPAGSDTSYYPPDYQQGPPGSASQRAWIYEDSMANEHIIGDMLKDDIITDERHVGFNLSGKTFIVNGVKQGDDIFRRYEEKYVPAENQDTDLTWSHTVNKEDNALQVLHAGGSFTDSLPDSASNADRQPVVMPKFNTPPPKVYNAPPKAYAPPPKAYEHASQGYDQSSTGYAYNGGDSLYQRHYDPNEYQRLQDSQKSVLAEIVTDMFHDGIISQKDYLDFTLDTKQFIVNGNKQEDAIFKRYKAKYVPANDKSNWSWTHSQHNPRPS